MILDSKKVKKSSFILIVLAFLIAFAALLSFGLKKQPSAPIDAKIHIITSFYPITFFTEQIAGDLAQVKNLIPAGVEPHDYELSPQDMKDLENANLVIINGGGLEPWAYDLKINFMLSGSLRPEIISAGESAFGNILDEQKIQNKDPHIWLDPIFAKKEVQMISENLQRLDSDHSKQYIENEKKLLDRLDQLDTRYKNELKNCLKKDIVTAHAAFGYLATRYGLHQVSIAGLSPDTEPTAQTLVNVADFVKANNVDYIFFETLVSPRLADTIAKETGVKTMELNPLEGLPGRGRIYAPPTVVDYFTVMLSNLANLKTALQCTL